MSETKQSFINVGNTTIDSANSTSPTSRLFRDAWVEDGSDAVSVDMDQAKAIAHKVRADWFQWRAFSDENHVSHSNSEFWSDTDSGSLVDGEAGYARDIEDDAPGTYSLSSGWKAVDGTYLPITNFADIKALKAAYRDHYNTAFAESQVKAAQIDAATTDEELADIVELMNLDIKPYTSEA